MPLLDALALPENAEDLDDWTVMNHDWVQHLYLGVEYDSTYCDGLRDALGGHEAQTNPSDPY